MKKFEFKHRSTNAVKREFNLGQTIEQFIDDKRLQNRSKRTIKTYNNALAHFVKYCTNNDLNGNEDDCVRKYIHYMTLGKCKWGGPPQVVVIIVGVGGHGCCWVGLV